MIRSHGRLRHGTIYALVSTGPWLLLDDGQKMRPYIDMDARLGWRWRGGHAWDVSCVTGLID